MISRAQIRAGRLLLQLSFDELAKRANIGAAIIEKWEAADCEPRITRGQAIAIRHALERAGVEFIGDGVKLRKGKEPMSQTIEDYIVELIWRDTDHLEAKVDAVMDQHLRTGGFCAIHPPS
jgi:transcriptional regulator with XRE-family HTH domain